MNDIKYSKKKAKSITLKKSYKPLRPRIVKSHGLFIFLSLIIILAVTFAAYYPALKNKFTNWDDGGYIIENLELKNFNPEGIKTQFSQYFMGNYHPLTMISLSADYAINKLNPFQFHLTNVILHLFNTVLVFWLSLLLLTRLKKELVVKSTILSACIAGILFGVHTLNVECVAWVSERKTLLYTFFFLFSIISYLFYFKSNSIKYYLLSIFLFIFSLFSKGMAVSLSLTLVICDYFLGRNLLSKKVIAEKIPFFILSLIFGVITILAQKTSNTIQFNSDFHFYERFLIGGYGFFGYLLKLAMPLGLSFFYGYPEKASGLMPLEYYLFPVITLIIILAVIYLRKYRIIVFGFLFFIANIAMVLQVIPVGFAVMADRYAYIPSIGLFFVVANIFNYYLSGKKGIITLLSVIFIAYLIILFSLTHQRTKTWYDGFSLWDAEIEHNPKSALAYKNRGRMKEDIGDFKGAFDDFNRAIMINPGYGEAYNGRGMARGNLNDLKGAIEDLDKAIKFFPDDHLSWNNRGIAKSMLKDYNGAIKDFTKAVELNPKFFKAYYNRGLAKSSSGDHRGAIVDFTISLRINSDQAEAWDNCGRERFFIKDYNGAIIDFDNSIRISKNNAETYYNRAIAKYYVSNRQGACEDWNISSGYGYSQSEEMIKRFCR